METRITMTLCKAMRADIEDALREVGEQYGLRFSLGRAKFTDAHVTFDLEGGAVAEDGTVVSRYQADFELYGQIIEQRYGLPQERLGQVFETISGQRYRLTGYLPRGKRYSFTAERIEEPGKTYKLRASALRRAEWL